MTTTTGITFDPIAFGDECLKAISEAIIVDMDRWAVEASLSVTRDDYLATRAKQVDLYTRICHELNTRKRGAAQ